jgi:uncharacterized protein
MNKQQVIKKTTAYIKNNFYGESSGHDWWHIYRVWQNAKAIGKKEKANMFVVEMAALLHDIADYKFHGGDENIGGTVAREYLEKMSVSEKDVNDIVYIIDNISFKGALVKEKMKSLEGKVVQDADRLDALGAIGIARVFATGAKLNRPIYDPNVKPTMHKNFKQYSKKNGHSINHFYEKLLLLKHRMNTKTGKKIANERHVYMQKYLDRFYKEWEAKI